MTAVGVSASRAIGSVDLQDTSVDVSISLNSWARVSYIASCLRSVASSERDKPRFPLRNWNFSGYIFTLFNLASIGAYITTAVVLMPVVEDNILRLLVSIGMALVVFPSFALDLGLFIYMTVLIVRFRLSNYMLWLPYSLIDGSRNRFLKITATLTSEQVHLMATSNELQSMILACQARVGVSGAITVMVYVSSWYTVYMRCTHIWILFCLLCEMTMMVLPILIVAGVVGSDSDQ